jgi:hypothetical protein
LPYNPALTRSHPDTMAYELTGTIKKIFDRQDFSSGFYKQEFVVTTEDRFPQDIKLDCLKEKVDLLQGFEEGSAVKVAFDIRGREYNERFYVDLAAWKIEAADAGEQPRANAPAKPAERRKSEEPPPWDDDVPF